jgi:hypothetical protein
MNKAIVAILAVVTLGVAAPERAEAKPGGCLKYGLGGAIAGHFAGGHRLKGAAAGCALGYIQRRRHQNAERDRLRDRNRGGISGGVDRDRSRDRGYARDDRGRFDPEDTGSLRRRAPGTDY